MNKNSILIILAAVVLIAIGGFLYSKNKPADNSIVPSPNLAADAVVVYTDSGFSPKTVAVKLGDTVAFQNESSGDLWVASAPHPVHTDYPEFDAKKAYKKGEIYSFTFEKAGTWKFHNHLKPMDFGSVTVE